MTDELNVFESTQWERSFGPVRGARLGPDIGARDLGCSLYELDPGGQAAPYHAHYANEELLIVLEGALELRTPDGTQEVGKGAVVASRACLNAWSWKEMWPSKAGMSAEIRRSRAACM